MPSITIGPIPVRVSQAVTDQATLQNTGTETIYMDTNSAVSSVAYGIQVNPRASLNWGAGQELWAVTESADSTLSILYGGEGVTVSEVGAVVTGDVTATIDGPVEATILGTVTVEGDVGISGPVTANISGTVPVDIQNAVINADVTGNIVVDSGTVQVGGIDTPVRVQGGGEVLVNQTANLAAGASVTVNIPAPASGLTYAGIGVIVRVNSSTGNIGPLTGTLYNNGFAIGSPTAFQAHLITGSVDNIGTPEVVQLVAPVGAAFPLRLDLVNNGSGTKNYTAIVVGLAYSDTMIRDFGQWEVSEGEISFDNAAANTFAAIAASFETRQYALTSATGTVGAFDSGILLSGAAWETTQIRLQETANVTPDSVYTVTIPGDGRIHRIRAINAVTGFVRLSYLGRIS